MDGDHHKPHQNNQPTRMEFEPVLRRKSRWTFLKSKLAISMVIITCVFITLLCIGLVVSYEKDGVVIHSVDYLRGNISKEQAIWFDKAIDELKTSLKVELNTRRAKNVILFVGDGMGTNTVTATRNYKLGEGGTLSWENFPHMGMLKTYCADRQVPDSMASATALFGGAKTNYETGGVDSNVHVAECEASLDTNHHVESVLQWAQEAGLATGFVTTTRVMHATPAALYAHTPDRRWECDGTMPAGGATMCKDIARQLIQDEPGKSINVIMGGGRQCLVSDMVGSDADPIDDWSCKSRDGRNLMDDWRNDKAARGFRHAVVTNTSGLLNLNGNVDYVLGVFANGHLKYEDERDKSLGGMPSLKEMTREAIRILKRNDHGFFLMVEGGLIDLAHHRGWAKRAIAETSAFDDAVSEAVLQMRDQSDETLIVVTADHGHTLSINGYAKLGDSMFGVAQNSKADNIPYTTLTYATGHFGFQVEIDAKGEAVRRDPTKDDTEAFDYVQQTAIYTDENTHGGGDVPIHAMGPMAHLFHKVHEQSYVPYVISYAARIGRFRDSGIVDAFLEFIGVR